MDGNMKAAVMTGPMKMEWATRPIPKPKPGELLIKLEYVGVCGSDLHFYQDGRLGNWVPEGPLVLGHEPGGVVVELGEGITGFAVGDRIAIEPGVPCGKCHYCKIGKYNLCVDMKFMAIPKERDGVFSEYCVHPAEMCYKLPDNMDTMEGALIEPLAVGFQAVSTSGAKVGDSAVIMGSGCIGLVTLLALRAFGVREIYVCDVIQKRLDKAAELGATKIFRTDETNVLQEMMRITNGEGVDFVFEAAGNRDATLLTAKLVKKGGCVLLIGMSPDPELTYDIGSLMDKEAELKTIFRYRNKYPAAIKAVSEGGLPVKEIVSHVYKFDDVIEGVRYNVENKSDVIKAVISFV